MQKYAIYRSPTGNYFRRYIDQLDQLTDPRLSCIITEELLPVVLDENGGFYRFSDKDYSFVRLMESDAQYPLSLEEMYRKDDPNFKLGWMSPDGTTYSCSYTDHTKAALRICQVYFPTAKIPERTLLKRGWLKIIDSWNGTEITHKQFVYSLRGELTRRQADRLFDVGLYYNEEVQEMISKSENKW